MRGCPRADLGLSAAVPMRLSAAQEKPYQHGRQKDDHLGG